MWRTNILTYIKKVFIFYIISYLKHSDRIKGTLDMFNPIKL